MLKGKTVFITGASSGMGLACAEQFAQLGARLIITARRLDRLQALAEKLIKQFNIEVLPLVLDVKNSQQVQMTIHNLSGAWKNIDILINNAGLSIGSEPFQTGNTADWDIVIDTNFKGLLYVSRAIIPGMIERNSGHIINIGSTAAHSYYAGGNVYCATKHAVKAISQCLRIDLAGTPIRVSEVDPGITKTEFNEVRWQDKTKAENYYKGYTPLAPDDIARSVAFCAIQPPHVNIVEVMLMPTEQNAPSMITKIGEKPAPGLLSNKDK